MSSPRTRILTAGYNFPLSLSDVECRELESQPTIEKQLSYLANLLRVPPLHILLAWSELRGIDCVTEGWPLGERLSSSPHNVLRWWPWLKQLAARFSRTSDVFRRLELVERIIARSYRSAMPQCLAEERRDFWPNDSDLNSPDSRVAAHLSRKRRQLTTVAGMVTWWTEQRGKKVVRLVLTCEDGLEENIAAYLSDVGPSYGVKWRSTTPAEPESDGDWLITLTHSHSDADHAEREIHRALQDDASLRRCFARLASSEYTKDSVLSSSSTTKGLAARILDEGKRLESPPLEAWVARALRMPSLGQASLPSVIAVYGEGPHSLVDIRARLRDLDVTCVSGLPQDASLVVVGRANWSEKHLATFIRRRRGKTLRIYSQELFFAFLLTSRDPLEEAESLVRIIAGEHPVLAELDRISFSWPNAGRALSPTAVGQVIEYDTDIGFLSSIGYHVGTTHNLRIARRRELLILALYLPLSQILVFNRSEWGEAGSVQRLQKLVNCLASFRRDRLNALDREDRATLEWAEDLQWLRVRFYDESKLFSWPSAAWIP